MLSTGPILTTLIVTQRHCMESPIPEVTQIGLEAQTDSRPSVQYDCYSAYVHETQACSTFCIESLHRIS
jgi:hypothetical protein